MEDDSLDKALQCGILSLLDIKPKDPIKFLATHFQMECETNLVAKAVHILQDMTIYHPAVEDRMLKAYSTICQYNEDGGLTGDIYSDLLVKLVCDTPSFQRDAFLQFLQCQSTEYVSFNVFRNGIFSALLFNQYVDEVKQLFAKICVENHDSASAFLCKKLLRRMSKCIVEAAKRTLDDKDTSSTLGILELSSPERKSVSKNLASADLVKSNVFLSEALDIFIREVSRLKFKIPEENNVLTTFRISEIY